MPSTPRHWTHRRVLFHLARYAVFVVLTVTATAVGYQTFDSDLEVSLVWPLYGVGALWLVSGSPRSRPWDTLALATVTVLTLVAEDAAWGPVAMGTLQVVVGALTWLGLSHLLTRGARQLDQPLSLWQVTVVVAASVGTAVVLAAMRLLGLGLLAPTGPETTLLLVVRNTSGILIGVVLGLLLLHRFGPSRSADRALTPERRRVLAEFVALLGLATWLATVVFDGAPMPVSFVLVLVVVVAAFRVRPLGAVVIAVAVGVIAVVATIEGEGTFVLSDRPFVSATIAQGFLITVVVAALAISIGVEERQSAIGRALTAEREAAGRASLFATVVEHLDEGVTVITADDDYTLRNRAAGRLTGQGGFLRPVAGDDTQPEMIDDAGVPIPVEAMPHTRARAEQRVVRETVRLRLPSGAERRIAISSIPVSRLGEDPRPVVVNTLRDVTDDHHERDELVSFAGVVAHDLKNPLTVIRGWTESLQEELGADSPLDVEALRSMAARVHGASEQMRHFIDDLLAITVARDRPLQLEQVDLSALGEEVAELRRAADTLPRISVQPGLRVTGDRFLLRQLLDNLVGNAVKYVAPGTRPSVAVTGRELDGEVVVAVTDNGIGIPPEQRERVFGSFVRAHAAGSYTGTGLGLAICHRVVGRHGGRIWIEDGSGPGTRICFTLPVAEDATTDPVT